MNDDTKYNLKGAGKVAASLGSLFVGGWAGPLGAIYWVVLTSLGLWKYGCTWENLKFCFIASFGLCVLAYWIMGDIETRKRERRKRVIIKRCTHCGNVTGSKVVYIRE